MNRASRLMILSFLAASIGACGRLNPPVTIAPPTHLSAPTLLGCTENPEGLALHVRSVGHRRVMVSGEGFQPGEELLLVFSAEVNTPTGREALRHEVRPVQSVRDDGTFTFEETMQVISSNAIWTLAVVHLRGTACVTFTVP